MRFLTFMSEEKEHVARLAQAITEQPVHISFGRRGYRMNELSVWATDEQWIGLGPFWHKLDELESQYGFDCPRCGGALIDARWCISCKAGIDRKPFTDREQCMMALYRLQAQLDWMNYGLTGKLPEGAA